MYICVYIHKYIHIHICAYICIFLYIQILIDKCNGVLKLLVLIYFSLQDILKFYNKDTACGVIAQSLHLRNLFHH